MREPTVVQLASTLEQAATLVDVLSAHGYDAIHVAGGTSAWAHSGRPMEKRGQA